MSRRRHLTIAWSLCCLLAGAASGAAADEPWLPLGVRQGVRLERRPVRGSSFSEVRASVHSPLSPARIAAALWVDPKEGRMSARLRKRREVLHESDTDRLVYELVATPVISDRDYTVRVRRSHDPATGAHRQVFQTENESGPPPGPGRVRIQTIRGEWSISPARDGGSDVVYRVYSEPGGSLPAWLVLGAQLDAARDLVLEVIEYAAAHAELGDRWSQPSRR